MWPSMENKKRVVICGMCNKEFFANKPNSKYCSNVCRRRANKQRERNNRISSKALANITLRAQASYHEIAQINETARQQGITYGQATAKSVVVHVPTMANGCGMK